MRASSAYAGISAVVLAASLLAALMVSSMFGRSVAEPIVHLAGSRGLFLATRNIRFAQPPAVAAAS